MIKNMICTEESKQDMKITVYFEIRNAELYGGINSIGYSEAGYTIKDNINKIDLSEKYIAKFLDKEIEKMAELLSVQIDDVSVISKEEYEENSPMANGKDKKMTPEEWKKVEDALSSPYGRVEFKIDGYDITIMCVVEKPLHYCLAVYVDGKIKVEWISQDCEIRRKFYQKHTKSLLNSKQKKSLKREKKDFREKILKESSYDWYEPYWKSVRSMKSHFIKNNKIIELVEAV